MSLTSTRIGPLAYGKRTGASGIRLYFSLGTALLCLPRRLEQQHYLLSLVRLVAPFPARNRERGDEACLVSAPSGRNLTLFII
ncbi:MAG: hypothetical protein AB2792_22720 [Candidatus Thiodiazotropha sp.]